jgi:hypothetical protein
MLFFPEIMHLVVEEINRYKQYLGTLDEAQTLLPDMIIGKVLVLIYYCADAARSDRHNER